ncbi:MAG TPA: DUF4870 domain-containing protein [Galbitalea sp.]|jgi:hypothetical protein|nr:DUF4870 domain-containing protein [Galbitalea sp.]
MSDPNQQHAAPTGAQPLSHRDDQLWAALAHLGGIFGILPSLIIFLALRKNGAATKVESKEALNWQITFLICWVVIDLVVLLLSGIYLAASTAGGIPAAGLPFLILELVWALLWLVNVIFSVRGFLTVRGGGSYRYPFAFRFIR